jgi:hypothetical protein
MSICDGCGGEYGHSQNCPEEARYREIQGATAPLKEENQRLILLTRRLKNALMDVLMADSREEAIRIAKRALEE